MESQQKRVEDSNIQLGIFIPTQAVDGKKLEAAAGRVDAKRSRENHVTESSGRIRKRFHSDNLDEDTELQTTNKKHRVQQSEEVPFNGGRTETELKSVSRKNKRKRLKKGQKLSSSQRTKAGIDREAALEYLRKWDRDISSWTFKKKTQFWLLKNAFDKSQVREN